LPIFGSDQASKIARNVKAFLNPESGVTRGTTPGAEQREDQAQELKNTEQREKIDSKRQRLRQIKDELRAPRNPVEKREREKEQKRIQLEIFQLREELRAATEGVEREEPQMGALPDFVVIGANKCGTTFFYHLLTQHPLVQPAAFKEPHFFDLLFEDEGVEWYQRCFPKPRWEDGRKTITGEATPGYLFDPFAPERMAKVIPEARLMALLRNPIDRAYSAYHHRVRSGRETRTFEEAMKEAVVADHNDPRHRYLSRGLYGDQLLRWTEYFDREQMLVLKSEDFFERPHETLKAALEFLGLPAWQLEASELENKRNAGDYGQGMDPAIRRRLEEYFEPHNKRLYDYLGVDFGW
jgi:hypothetical protein